MLHAVLILPSPVSGLVTAFLHSPPSWRAWNLTPASATVATQHITLMYALVMHLSFVCMHDGVRLNG